MNSGFQSHRRPTSDENGTRPNRWLFSNIAGMRWTMRGVKAVSSSGLHWARLAGLGALFWSGALWAEQTVNVIVNSQTGQFVLGEGGVLIGSEGRLSFGFLDTEGLVALLEEERIPELEEFTALFDPLDEWSFAADGSIQLLGVPMQSNRVGDQLYIFVYTVDGRFVGFYTSSNALWTVPVDPGGATLSSSLIDEALAGSIVAGSPKTYELLRLMRDPYPVERWLMDQLGSEVPEEWRALEADPDEDGISNLVEYALLTDPATPDGRETLVRDTVAGKWRFKAWSNDPQLTYRIEFSSDFAVWESLELGFDSDEERWEIVTPSDASLAFAAGDIEGSWILTIDGAEVAWANVFARVVVDFAEEGK